MGVKNESQQVLFSLASDNTAPVHPKVFQAMEKANQGSASAYGADDWTAQLEALARQKLGAQAHIFPVFNGTGANVVSLFSMLRSFEAVVCAHCAHVNVDECGALERFSGAKILVAESSHGKLTTEALAPFVTANPSEHHVVPKVVSITQSTELGTVYSMCEVQELSEWCKRHGFFLHVDGARVSNAAVSLKMDVWEWIRQCGADVVSFGGTKNGAMMADAVVVLSPQLLPGFKHLRKQAMQLASKQRFVAAQFLELFGTDLWKENATHANACARQLSQKVEACERLRVDRPVEANAVFVRGPQHLLEALQLHGAFYLWEQNLAHGEAVARLMCSWSTTAEELVAFDGALKSVGA